MVFIALDISCLVVPFIWLLCLPSVSDSTQLQRDARRQFFENQIATYFDTMTELSVRDEAVLHAFSQVAGRDGGDKACWCATKGASCPMQPSERCHCRAGFKQRGDGKWFRVHREEPVFWATAPSI